jgi:hypothetical protein
MPQRSEDTGDCRGLVSFLCSGFCFAALCLHGRCSSCVAYPSLMASALRGFGLWTLSVESRHFGCGLCTPLCPLSATPSSPDVLPAGAGVAFLTDLDGCSPKVFVWRDRLLLGSLAGPGLQMNVLVITASV